MKIRMRKERQRSQSPDRHLWKGLAAGLVGGLVASWAMNRFQEVWSKLAAGHRELPGASSLQPVSKPAAEVQQASSEAPDDTTVKTASAISAGLFDHKLTEQEKKVAGTAVHYSLGTGVGGLYGATAELAPGVTAVAGLPFGAAFWLVVDEGAVPFLGLAKGPAEYPLSTHVYALTSHLLFGLTAEVVRRAVRRAL